MTFPTTFGPAELPPSVATLVKTLLPRLIEGPHPALVALRGQPRQARITSVEMTGHGFFAHFAVSPEAPLADPRHFAGGHAHIELADVQHGAGCVLFVKNGRIDTFEGFVFVGTWAIDAQVIGVTSIEPVDPD